MNELRLPAIFLLFCLVASGNALAKGSGVSVKIGAGGGSGSGAVRVAQGDSETVYSYRNRSSTAWVQFGTVMNSILLTDFGVFGTQQTLKSDYTEDSMLNDSLSGSETIKLTGGGLLYSLTILFGAGSEAALYTALGVGSFRGSIEQSGDTIGSQNYGSGMGGCFDFGLLLGTGKGGSKSHLELFLGTETIYSSMTRGSDSELRSLSDLYVGTIGWQVSVSFKI